MKVSLYEMLQKNVFEMQNLWLMKVKNPVSQNIRIFPKINKKKRICTTEKFFKVCSLMHSILGRGSFSTNSSISEVEAISLWHWGTIEPSARLYCWIDCFSSFSWRYFIDSIDIGLDKSQWTNTRRHHGTANHHWLRNFILDFKQLGFCASPLFLQTPDLDFQTKSQINFYLKRGLWTT